jgi:hypothetical protein
LSHGGGNNASGIPFRSDGTIRWEAL